MKDSRMPDGAEYPNVDEHWMNAALHLARVGIGLTSPNPAVGCVIVRRGMVVGQGWHEYAKRDHAEVVALAAAGDSARGATAYVTLEPCSHQGRTPPCADALIRAGVARVVAATVDPNPLVSGSGMQRLRDAGIEVVVGVMQEPARRLNDGFACYVRNRRPLVTLKAALSLDGRIAPPPQQRTAGNPVWLTGEESRRAVHQMRHQSDALITGIQTVLDDDPLLTDRSGLARRRPLLRVVLDSDLRLPPASKLVQSAKDDVLVFCTMLGADRRKALEDLGVRVELLEPATGGRYVPLQQVLLRLGQLEISTAMVEAGTRVNRSALELADRFFLFYAPVFLGSEGLPLFHAGNGPPVWPSFQRMDLHRFGPDFAFEAWTNDPWVL